MKTRVVLQPALKGRHPFDPTPDQQETDQRPSRKSRETKCDGQQRKSNRSKEHNGTDGGAEDQCGALNRATQEKGLHDEPRRTVDQPILACQTSFTGSQ